MAILMRCATFTPRFHPLAQRYFCSPMGSGVAPIKIDVEEDDRAYTVHANLPGVRKEDISVTVEGSEVAIAAQVKRDRTTQEGGRVLRSERFAGRAYRRFSLEQEVDEAAVQASYADGVLRLTLPKKSVPGGHKIVIN